MRTETTAWQAGILGLARRKAEDLERLLREIPRGLLIQRDLLAADARLIADTVAEAQRKAEGSYVVTEDDGEL